MNWKIVLIIAVCIIGAVATRRTYYVLSSDSPATQCPVETCPSLTALLESGILCDDATNVTLLLYQGMHVLNSSVNRVFCITSATNFTMRSFDSSQRATILCNGNIGFEFDSCINLTITNINIENCGALKYLNTHFLREANFSLYISHSLGVYVTDICILNGTGIGLLLENVQYQLLILGSILSHSDVNLYITTYDNNRVKSIPSSMRILNSNFSDARDTRREYHSGVAIRTYQTKFYVELELKKVDIVHSNFVNLNAQLNLCTSAIKLQNLNSISVIKEQNLNIFLMHSTKCPHVEQPNFIGGKISIEGKKSTKQQLLLITLISHNFNKESEKSVSY